MTPTTISIKGILIFLLLVAGLTAGVLLLREQVRTRPKATVATQTTIYLDPASAVMPPNQTLKVMLDVGAFQVGFVRVEADFDPTKIQLTDEISISPTHPLQTVMSKTTKTAANNSGHVDIMVGLPPENMSNPATGVFELAQIPVSTVSTITNDAASFTISTSGPQVADLDQVELTFTAIPADFTLNAAGDTPTPTPTTTACFADGESCNIDAECCSTTCLSSTRSCGVLPTSTPAPTLTPTPTIAASPTPTPTSTNCSNNGESCNIDAECCSGTCLSDTRSCGVLPTSTPVPSPTPTPTTAACGSAGQTCNTDNECCSGLQCNNVGGSGTCGLPPTLATCNVADINKDGIVNDGDYMLLLTDYFKTTPDNPRSDINSDGIVDITDYSLMAANYQQSTGSCQ